MVKNNLARLAIAGTFLLSANWAWGTTAACSQPSPTTISNLQTTAGFGSYCYETDKTFSNVTVTDGGSTAGGVTQSASTIALQGSDNLSTYTTGVPWMVAANFVGATPADFQASSTSSGSYAATYGQMTFLVTSSSTAANLAYPTPQAGQFNDITGVSLAADATIGNSSTTDFAQVEMAFCIGSASCTADNIVESYVTIGGGVPAAGCSAGRNAGIVVSSCTLSAASVTFASAATTLNVIEYYTAYAQGGTSTTSTLNYFQDIFTEEEMTPEPSTFLLIGSALAGIAALRLRAIFRKGL